MDNTNGFKKIKKQQDRKHSHLYLGLFYFLSGFFLLLNNYVTLPTGTVSVLLLGASLYLIVLAILNKIRKIYYVFGLVLFSLLISLLISVYGEQSILWPIIMVVISMGLLFYGVYFKRDKHLKYTIPALVLLGMGLLVGFVVLGGKVSLAFIFKLWPLLLIFFAGYQIYLKKKINKIYAELEDKKESHADPDDTSAEKPEKEKD